MCAGDSHFCPFKWSLWFWSNISYIEKNPYFAYQKEKNKGKMDKKSNGMGEATINVISTNFEREKGNSTTFKLNK